MDRELTQEYVANAEMALENGRHAEALEWLRMAISEDPTDVYALSRAGAVCVSQELFDEALDYFQRALAVDPSSGDSNFNLGNAYFFRKDFNRAFAYYVEAENLGCSLDVMIQLNYQMMLLSTIRGDLDSARIYMQKMEDLDPSGTISLTPDFISEKLKLEMLCQNFTAARKYASQLVSVEPGVFRHYAVYYSLLMAEQDYDTAHQLLNRAQRYAHLTEEDEVSLASLQASVMMSKAQADPDRKDAYVEDALRSLKQVLAKDSLSAAQREQVSLTLCDIYYQAERYDDVIACAAEMLGIVKEEENSGYEQKSGEQNPDEEDIYLDDAELNQIIRQDLARLYSKVSPEQVRYPRMGYTRNGTRGPVFDEAVLTALDEPEAQIDPIVQEAPDTQAVQLSDSNREKLYFNLMNSYLAKDDFKNAGLIGGLLRYSDNRYYGYYGLYVHTMSTRYDGSDPETSRRAYEEAIAFFRNCVVKQHTDTLAAVFRARLYAESGKYEQARRLSDMLPEQDRQAVLNYIEELKNPAGR